MIDNRQLLDELITQGDVRIARGSVLSQSPPLLPPDFSFDRVEGMLLGLAIGDALGNTSEGQTPAERQEKHGEIRHYLPNWYADNRPLGVPSDDTQLAFWTLEHLLENDGLVPQALAERFCQQPIYGIGSTVRRFLHAFKKDKVWYKAGQESAGNGALMRIAPVIIPHLAAPSAAMWADAVLAGMITHNDYASNAFCVAFCGLLWHFLGRDQIPAPGELLDMFCEVGLQLEGDQEYQPCFGSFKSSDTACKSTAQWVMHAYHNGWSTLKACNELGWGSGAYLLETMPSVLYILMLHGDDPEEAIIRAVNDTRDNDTVAAIVGAAVGALHGKSALPQRWLDGLLGRTVANDDGRIIELIAAAREKWGTGTSS